MNKIILSIMALFTGCMAGCGQQAFRTVDADEFEKAILTDSVQLVDVRTAEEFSEARIGSAEVKNIDMKQPDFMRRAAEELYKGKTVAVYCRSGRRSAKAAGWLAGQGYKVIDLKGGILEWQERGKNTTR